MLRKTLHVDQHGTWGEDGRVLAHGMEVVHDMELVHGTGVVHGMEVLVHDMQVRCGREVLRGMKLEILHSREVPCGREVAHDMGLAHKDLGHGRVLGRGKAAVHCRVLGRGRPLHHSTDPDHRWALDGDKTQSHGIPMDLDYGEDQACENQMEPYGEKVSCELCGVSCASCGVVFQ